MQTELYNRIRDRVENGLKAVKELEDVISFQKSIGQPTHEIEDRYLKQRRELLKMAEGLIERGYTVNTHGVTNGDL